MIRKEDILSDVHKMREERALLLDAMQIATPDHAAIMQRRVGKIEERFSEVGLSEDGGKK